MTTIEKVLALLAKRELQYRESGSRGTLGNCDSRIATALRAIAVEAIALAAEEPAEPGTRKPEPTWEEAWKGSDAIVAQIPHGSKWFHIKRGTKYAAAGLALFQDATGSGEHDMELVVIYWSYERGAYCARRASEFLDGRFEKVL